MIKTKIVETTEKYDKDGKLVEKITREETSEDDTVYESGAIYYPQEPVKAVCKRNETINGGTVIFTNPPIYEHAESSCCHAKPSECR